MTDADGAVKDGHGQAPSRSVSSSETWGRASLKSALVLILAVVGFGVIPDRMITFLSTRVVPNARDLLVTLWVVAFFVFLTWLYVRLQPRGRRP